MVRVDVDINIQEGGAGKNLNGIARIVTNKQGGGSQTWIPEDELDWVKDHVKSKTIKKNGTFKAEDDNAYAWDTVHVNVKVIGKKNDTTVGGGGGSADPNEYLFETDEQTGETKATAIPSKIDITHNPTKTEYVDGESIVIDGIIVKALKADNNEWQDAGYPGGVIPNNELSIDPTTASRDSGDGHGSIENVVFSAIGGESFGMQKKSRRMSRTTYEHWDVTMPSGRVCLCKQGNNNVDYIACVSTDGYIQATAHETWDSPDGQDTGYTPYIAVIRGTEVLNGVTYYYSTFRWGSSNPDEGVPSYARTTNSDCYEWWSSTTSHYWVEALYGDGAGLDGNKVTVKWKRPQDDKELTDTFDITVQEKPSGDTVNPGL